MRRYVPLLFATFALSCVLLLAACETEPDNVADDLEPAEATDAALADPYAFSALDEDADETLTQEEFGAGYDAYGGYERMDRDASGYLDEEEVSLGTFPIYDVDEDGFLNATEAGLYGQSFGETSFALEDLDLDDDDQLSQQELSAGLSESRFAAFDKDADSRVTPAEFEEAVYRLYDADESGGIDAEEYAEMRPYWMRDNTPEQDTAPPEAMQGPTAGGELEGDVER